MKVLYLKGKINEQTIAWGDSVPAGQEPSQVAEPEELKYPAGQLLQTVAAVAE